MGLTADLCGIIRATRYDTLDEACVHKVKQAIKDGIAVALAGCREQPVALMVDHMTSLGGMPQSSVWGWGLQLAPTQAAYINAVATHVLDFEPMWSPPTHSVSPTVPVAFALAESRRLSGRDIIAAVANGLEIQGRLQYAGNQYVPEKLRFHPPGVAGVLGSAVVASELLGLDRFHLQHALGIAASRAGALLANVGSMTKCTHCGNAAAGGLDAALLASRGFTANPDVLEADKGYIATYYPDGFDAKRLLAYGRPFRVVDPGLAIKLFPSQFGTHYAISAGLEMRGRVADPEQIEHVHITSPVMKYVDRPRPHTGLDGKFSLQYVTAAALLDGKVTIDTFVDERCSRPDMVRMLERVTLSQDESIPGDFHHMHIAAEALLRDGSRVRAVCHGPKGAWGVPLDDSDHRVKLEDCLSRALPAERVMELLQLLDRLETLDAGSIGRVTALIAARPRLERPAASASAL